MQPDHFYSSTKPNLVTLMTYLGSLGLDLGALNLHSDFRPLFCVYNLGNKFEVNEVCSSLIIEYTNVRE